MTRRLTVFPPPQAPPHLYQQVPAIKRIREAYQKRFEVTVFGWPFFDNAGARSPDDVVSTLGDALSPGGFVVAEAPAVTALLVALDNGARRPDAFVAVGLDPTNATMRSLGLGEVVEAAKRITDHEGRLRQVKSFLSDVVGDLALLSELDREVPWEAVFAFEDWIEEVDQLTLGPFEDVIGLVFTSSMFPLLAEGETEHVFQRIFPNSRSAHVEQYPRGLDNPSTGDEVTTVVIPFLESVSAAGSNGAAVEAPMIPESSLKSSGEVGAGSLARPNRSWEAGPYMWGGVWRLRRR
ncbi:MAG TPA: hypothetical protein VFO84_05930 [Dehalococcoidia bacterium]|nr:hypothetical protein [Dehalococcoidia bacterium]